jgi:hypothetical protein
VQPVTFFEIGEGIMDHSPGFSGSSLQGSGKAGGRFRSFYEVCFSAVDVWMLPGMIRGVPVPEQRNADPQSACDIEGGLPAVIHHDPGGDGRGERRAHADPPNGDADA